MAVEWVSSLVVRRPLAALGECGPRRSTLLDSLALLKTAISPGAGSTLFIRSRPADVIAPPPTHRGAAAAGLGVGRDGSEQALSRLPGCLCLCLWLDRATSTSTLWVD